MGKCDNRADYACVSSRAVSLADDYGALEPHISGKIMEIHHKGHHQTYVNNLNQALEQISEAKASNNEIAAASLASALNFNGGGHTNHTLFWDNLAPANKGGGGEPTGSLKVSRSPEYALHSVMSRAKTE